MTNIIQVLQGSDDWLKIRADHYTASEAPAAMGESKYVTRTELMRQKLIGMYQEVDDAKQALFDSGHAAENAARSIAEGIIGSELYPVTCSLEVDGLPLLASLDGLTMDGIIWEHKLFSESLAADVRSGNLAPHYTIQLDQQLLVADAKKCLFMTSDGTEKNMAYCWYEPSEKKFDSLIAGWKQFEKDLAEYVPVEIVEKPTAEVSIELPALFVHAKGEITTSNMKEYGLALSEKLEKVRAIQLITDQDFSNAEAAAKLFREQCQKLKLAKEAMLEQTLSIGEAARMIDAWHEDLRVTALKLEKDVEKEKEAKKINIVTNARNAYGEYIASLEKEISPIRLELNKPDFALAMKGKKLFSAMQNAVDNALANAKIEADSMAKDIRSKLAWCKESANGMSFLFPDLQQLITKPLDDFKLVITTRIEKHKADEAAKLEAERTRIRQEEETMARTKVDAEIAQDAAAFAQRVQEKNPFAENIAQPVLPAIKNSVSKAASMTKKSRPSDDELIDALTLHFRVHESLVIEWLLDMDLNAAAGRLAEELT